MTYSSRSHAYAANGVTPLGYGKTALANNLSNFRKENGTLNLTQPIVRSLHGKYLICLDPVEVMGKQQHNLVFRRHCFS